MEIVQTYVYPWRYMSALCPYSISYRLYVSRGRCCPHYILLRFSALMSTHHIVNRLNYIDWLSKLSGEMTLFFCSNGQQTDLLTIRASFLQKNIRAVDLEEMQQNIEIQVSSDLNQSTIGCSQGFGSGMIFTRSGSGSGSSPSG